MANETYIESIRRDFALYVLQQRAIPAVADGLKPSGRRLLWTARDGRKYKSATLAGATMPIHPHASADKVINTLTGKFINNYPLFEGYGAFGSLRYPNTFGASRYTSVKTSDFTNDVIFKDIEIIPMVENYDSTLMEPLHFLPLVPIALLNPSEGIAIGYSTTILPRKLNDIINAQIAVLDEHDIKEIVPSFMPINSIAQKFDDKWMFVGEFQRINTTTIKITKIPYGTNYYKILGSEKSKLSKLLENDSIIDYEDHCKDFIDIRVKFKRGILDTLSDDDLYKMLGLKVNAIEHLNLIGFDNNSILCEDVNFVITEFTKWRLTFYSKRYEKIKKSLITDIQKYKDVILAINNNAGNMATKMKNKKEFKEWLISINIINDEYISNLPAYRYTKEEKNKIEKILIKQQKELDNVNQILSSEIKRKNIYKKELNEILSKYG
jgi:DNA gyrase/topoisomerase IV subunit A